MRLSSADVLAYLHHLGHSPDPTSLSRSPAWRTALFLQGCVPAGDTSTARVERWSAGCLGIRSTPAPRPAAEGATLELRPTPNVVDGFNDTALLVGANGSLSAYVGTVDAGSTLKNTQGIAHLVFGHPHRFVPGRRHNEDRTPCFRPVDEVNRFRRDADYDHVLEANEGVVTAKNCGLLIHAMGGQGEDWADFKAQGDAHCAATREPLQVVIMPAADIERWLRERESHLPTLHPGATGWWVAALQDALRDHGADLKVDTDFGDKTTAAVLAFQKARGLKADAVVGPLTWAALRGEP